MCALKRSLLAPTPFVSALGELLSRLYDRGCRRDRESGGSREGDEGPQPNKTKNGPPFTMPRIYIISRNLRHFRSSRFAPFAGWDWSEINLRGAVVFPGRALLFARTTESSKERAFYTGGKSARGRLIGPMRHAEYANSRLTMLPLITDNEIWIFRLIAFRI